MLNVSRHFSPRILSFQLIRLVFGLAFSNLLRKLHQNKDTKNKVKKTTNKAQAKMLRKKRFFGYSFKKIYQDEYLVWGIKTIKMMNTQKRGI